MIHHSLHYLLHYPQSRWRKFMFKAPLILWRMGLGFIIGRYLMLISTTGRKSGLPRHTLAEWHPLGERQFVPVAFGEDAQWYKNILHNPIVNIQSSRFSGPVQARRISNPDEVLAAVHVLRKRNPAMTRWYLESRGVPVDADEAQLRAAADRLYLLTFEPTAGTAPALAPAALRADLIWLWLPIVMFKLFVWWLLMGRRP